MKAVGTTGPLGLALGLWLASTAAASDGVIEINQARALAGGVSAGDVAGFPVTLSERGSYALTGNLDVPSATTGILITTAGVSLDLRGFTIQGPGTCSGTGSGLTCTQTTSGAHGVDGSAHEEVSVRSGTIRGFGGDGVVVGEECHLSDLTAVENNGDGLDAGRACVLERNVSKNNGGEGMVVADAGTVSTSSAWGNRLDGFEIGNGCTVQGNSSRNNGEDGFSIAFGAVAIGNVAYLNESDGFDVRGGTLVKANTAYANSAYQIYSAFNTDCVYRENVLYLSSAVVFTLNCFDGGGNVCNGAPCP